MRSETFSLAVLPHGANHRAVSPPEGLHAPPHQPALPRTLCSLGTLRLSAGNANLPIGVEMPSTLNFRLSTVLFSNSCAFLEKLPLCFHILTNSFSRSSFILTSIQIARGCPPLPQITISKNMTPKPANSNPASRSHIRGWTLTAETGERSVRVRAVLAARPEKWSSQVCIQEGTYAQNDSDSYGDHCGVGHRFRGGWQAGFRAGSGQARRGVCGGAGRKGRPGPHWTLQRRRGLAEALVQFAGARKLDVGIGAGHLCREPQPGVHRAARRAAEAESAAVSARPGVRAHPLLPRWPRAVSPRPP